MQSLTLTPLLGLGQVVALSSSYYLLGVLADPISRALGMPPATLFVALSAAFLLSAILTPASGRAIERFGGRVVQGFAHVAFALALSVMAIATRAEVLWTGVVLLGVGMGTGLYGTAFAIVVERRGADAGRTITGVSLIGSIGGLVGWPASAAAVEACGWQAACWGWAVIHLLICLPSLAAIAPRRKAPTVTAQVRPSLNWDRRMIQMAALIAGSWFITTAMGAHLPRVLVGLGLNRDAAAWTASLMAMSAIAARGVHLLVGGRRQTITTVRIACLAQTTGAAITLLSGIRALPLLAIGQGIGNGLLSVAAGVLPLHVFGPDRYARRQAMLLTPARYLQAAAPAAYAMVLDTSARLGLVVTAALSLAMLVLTVGMVGRPSRETPPCP